MCIRDSRYKEIMFPRYEDLSAEVRGATAPLEPHGLHIWPRGSHFLMALANKDGSFTGTIYCDSKGDENSFAEVRSFVHSWNVCSVDFNCAWSSNR